MAPGQMALYTDATKDLPLLPRDISTAQIYQTLATFMLEDGYERYPMAAKIEVSETLDIITQTVGDGLIRTQAGWEGVSLANPQLGQVIADVTISTPVPFVQLDDLAQWTYVAFIGHNLTASASTVRRLNYSIDNGINFLTSNGDYIEYNQSGQSDLLSGAPMQFGSSTAGRGGIIVLGPNLASLNIVSDCRTRLRANWCPAHVGPVTNARLDSQGANLTAGRFVALGWR